MSVSKTIVALLILGGQVLAEVRLASVFSDHMVLQRDKPVPVWGTARPGEKLRIEFAGQSKAMQGGADGKWSVTLDPMPASVEPRKLEIHSSIGSLQSSITNILIGDVWLCGGQSNMKWALGGTLEGQAIIQSADHPNLRLLKVPKRILKEPSETFDAAWSAATPENVGGFSAVGYIFGQRVHRETGIPIGLIMCAEGSTSVECWVSNETLQNELFAPAIAKWKEVEAEWADPAVRKKHIHNKVKDPDVIQPSDARTYPGGCFNGMLNPLFPFAFKGVVWYQGVANRQRGIQYRDLFPFMISEWRTRFDQDDLPFYIVQLPEIGKPKSSVGDSLVAELREAQALTAEKDPLVEMAVIIDSDQNGNIHPKNKQLPAERLARIALAKDCGQNVAYSGPVFRSMEIRGDVAYVTFAHAEGMMTARRTGPASLEIKETDEPLANFALAGADKVFYRAEAEIEGETVVVSSDAVKNPVAVRYAWSDSPVGCNLYNAAGLPAGPFRTDEWPCRSENAVEGNVLIIR